MPSTRTALLKGTTTIGIVCKDGVVLATERRATAGTMISNKQTQKLFKIDQNIGITIAGLVGDAQVLTRYLRAEVSLYRLRRNAPRSARRARRPSSPTSCPVTGTTRTTPGSSSAASTAKGNHVFSVDPAGGCIEDRFVSVGSGSTFAYGILEESYTREIRPRPRPSTSLCGASPSAMKRDSASGDGYLVHVITAKEYRELSEDEINKRLKALKIPLPPVLP